MTTMAERFCGARTRKRSTQGGPAAEEPKGNQNRSEIPGIIDHKVILLAVAGAAVKSDNQPCLKEIVRELEQAGVAEEDIRRAVENGQLPGVYGRLGTDVLGRVCDDGRVN